MNYFLLYLINFLLLYVPEKKESVEIKIFLVYISLNLIFLMVC